MLSDVHMFINSTIAQLNYGDVLADDMDVLRRGGRRVRRRPGWRRELTLSLLV